MQTTIRGTITRTKALPKVTYAVVQTDTGPVDVVVFPTQVKAHAYVLNAVIGSYVEFYGFWDETNTGRKFKALDNAVKQESRPVTTSYVKSPDRYWVDMYGNLRFGDGADTTIRGAVKLGDDVWQLPDGTQVNTALVDAVYAMDEAM